jgi:chemotaxis protein MotB
MKNQNQIALIKEQLRAKDRELKNVSSLLGRNDQRFQKILALNEQKINELEKIKTDQEEEIKNNLTLGIKTEKKDGGEEKEESKSSVKEKEDSGGQVQVEEIIIQDPKLQQEVNDLRTKNRDLKKKIDEENKNRKKLDKEKSILIKQFKKQKITNDSKVIKLHKKLITIEELTEKSENNNQELRQENDELSKEKEEASKSSSKLEHEKSMMVEQIKKIKEVKEDPGQIREMKEQVKLLQGKIEESHKRSSEMITEKEDLIESYEKMLFVEGQDKSTPGEKPLLIKEVVKELKDELGTLKDEKEKAEQNLIKIKKEVEAKVNAERRKIEEKYAEHLKDLQGVKSKANEFSNEVMEEDASGGWITTFADMVTLLLTFFILMYSLSSTNLQQFQELLLGEESASIGMLELLDSIEIKQNIESLTATKSKDILTEIKEVAEEKSEKIDVATDKSKIIVRVSGNSLFESGDSFLVKDARIVLDEIVQILKSYPQYKTNIQGHTDDIPISTERFPTNWELSAARATAVLRFFIDKGIDPLKVTATGYADLFPLFTNETEFGRSKNRRVEFVLEKEKR